MAKYTQLELFPDELSETNKEIVIERRVAMRLCHVCNCLHEPVCVSSIGGKDVRRARGSWAPGQYEQTCSICGKMFFGGKNAVECAECAYADADDE